MLAALLLAVSLMREEAQPSQHSRGVCEHAFRVFSASISTLGPAGRGVSAERWGRSMEHGEIGRWWALRVRLECTNGEAERRYGALRHGAHDKRAG